MATDQPRKRIRVPLVTVGRLRRSISWVGRGPLGWAVVGFMVVVEAEGFTWRIICMCTPYSSRIDR